MPGRSKPASFAVSMTVHGLIFAWVASGPVREKPRSLYAQMIAPHESKVIWYDFREKLPNVASAPKYKAGALKAPRAAVKIAPQQIQATAKTPGAHQLVWQPEPQPELKKEVKSPNVIAVRREPRKFVAPVERAKAAPEMKALPEAPIVAAAKAVIEPAALKTQLRAPPRTFVMPAEKRTPVPEAKALPDAPTIAAAAAAMVPSALKTEPLRAPPHDFVAPAAPEISPSAVNIAIVSLNPAPNAPPPRPEGTRSAQFSAALQTHRGSDALPEPAMLTVPGLTIRNEKPDTKAILMARAAPTSAENLRAAVRGSLPAAASEHSRPAAARVSQAPDPMLDGRAIYAMSVQMPNITSYSGSWLIWFAERGNDGPAAPLSPPVPLHKVDPKYYPAAMQERVEGKVRLAAIIRKDGRVEVVRLLQHLDDRLDHSAAEAVDQWRFDPALRDGQPVEVDAVIEIPFRLAPLVPR